ncbi:hypothetical protein V2G26_011386 [Clonostachys chloroleuca]
MSPNDRVILDKEFCAGSAGIVEISAQPCDGNLKILCVKGSRIGRVSDTGTPLIRLDDDSFDFGTTIRFISEIEGFLRLSASMDICPYGATDDDYDGHDLKWLQEARYRVPVADVHPNANWHTMARATALSKVGFDNLMEICRLSEEMTGQDQRFMLTVPRSRS